jgi:phosphinothricin acetyltransferase
MATADDAPAVREIYAPIVRNTATSFEENPPSVSEVRERIDSTTEERPWLVAERESEVVGYAYASRHSGRPAYRWSVDVSAYVREDAHRTGVGRRLYDALLACLREQGYYNAYAVIALPNEASVGFHEAMGFEPVGVYDGVGYKLDAWHDVGHWHNRLAPLPETPDPPTPVPNLDDEVLDRALGGE